MSDFPTWEPVPCSINARAMGSPFAIDDMGKGAHDPAAARAHGRQLTFFAVGRREKRCAAVLGRKAGIVELVAAQPARPGQGAVMAEAAVAEMEPRRGEGGLMRQEAG